MRKHAWGRRSGLAEVAAVVLIVTRCCVSAPNATALPEKFSGPAGNPGFSYYVLALYWPPATFTDDGQEIARQLIGTGEASPGFWTHGLWPAR
jgi:ribonuclease I